MQAPAHSYPSLSVLAVDDDEICLDIVQELLSQLNVGSVQVAGNGTEALRTLRSLPRDPDFVILDVYMPGMDGIEFMNELARRQFKGGIILATGSDVEMLNLARQLAVAGGLHIRAALLKPLHIADLAQALQPA